MALAVMSRNEKSLGRCSVKWQKRPLPVICGVTLPKAQVSKVAASAIRWAGSKAH